MYLGQSDPYALNQRTDFLVTKGYRPTMRYYASDRFPYAQGPGGPYEIYPSTPGLDNPPFQSFPISQPGAICAAGSTKLNFFRPNQALVRGVVGRQASIGLGDGSLPIVPLAIAGGALLFLFGSNLLTGRRRG
jgi:hypothetical protein